MSSEDTWGTKEELEKFVEELKSIRGWLSNSLAREMYFEDVKRMKYILSMMIADVLTLLTENSEGELDYSLWE